MRIFSVQRRLNLRNLKASYKIAYSIAKQKKAHTIGETLVNCFSRPCRARLRIGENKKIEAVPLSNDVIHPRIVYISPNILKQVNEELTETLFPFSMQLNEATIL